tara:strand:+ start:319 stop:1068 length:750 start_codon:yes stop_codon:yes gene_type:complete
MATTKATTLAHTLGGISSDISTAEINRLDGLTGDIQTQITALDNAKAPKASPTFTGTITAPNDSISGDAVSGGTIGAGTFSGTLSSNATLPAGTVLQVKSHISTHTQNHTGGSTDYYVQSNGNWGTGTTSPWSNITIKKANSTLVFTVHAYVFFNRNTVNGNFGSINWYIRYSTNSNLSSSTDTARLGNIYQDCRWYNYTSEQEKLGGSGTLAVTTSYAKDTVVYYTVKATAQYASIYPASLQVLELAT